MGIFYLMNNTGQIVRSRKTGRSRYTPITNDILQSRDLTPEEKSILIYLLSMPEDWVVVKSQLFKWANFGRDSVNKAWRGLIEKGYVVSIRVFNSKGQFDGWNHVVYEEPVLDETTQTEEPDLLKTRKSENPKVGETECRENRSSENQSLYKVINEESNNYTKESFKESNNPTKEEVVETIDMEAAFEQVWKAYNGASTRQVGSKQEAKKKFLNLKKNELEALRVNLPIFIKSLVAGGKADFFPNLTTYLNQKRFLDEKPPVADKVAEFEKKHNNWFE